MTPLPPEADEVVKEAKSIVDSSQSDKQPTCVDAEVINAALEIRNVRSDFRHLVQKSIILRNRLTSSRYFVGDNNTDLNTHLLGFFC